MVCRLSRGDKVEVFLDGEGDVIGGEFGFGLYTIPAFTDHPQIDPERRPSWYKNDTYLMKRFRPDRPKDMGGPTIGGPVPLAFPTRDVTVTYRSSANPGQVYTAAFSRSMQRIVVRTPGGSVATRQHFILDPAVYVETTVDDRHQTYFVVPYTDVVADRFKWPGLHPKAGGSEVIAGLSCTDYELETAGLYIPPVQPVTVCLTKDGVRLRRTQAGVTMTATSIVYGNVSADDCLVPDGYTRVQGEEDRKAGPRPIPMP